MPKPFPATASAIGLSKVVFAPLLQDDSEGVTYGKVRRLRGAIEASISNVNSDPLITYADDAEHSILYPDPELRFRLKLADLPLLFQQMFFDGAIDSNGVWVRSARRKPYYYAIGFRTLKANGKYRYIWLYKCRANAITESYGTKSGPSLSRREPEIEFTALRLRNSGVYHAVADEDCTRLETAWTFLSGVYGYRGDGALVLDAVHYRVSRNNTALVLDSDESAVYSVNSLGSAIVITTA